MSKISKNSLLLVQIFIVSTCSLIYELIIGTTTTNITSNSVLAFSLVIGLFLAGLGFGAFCSQWVFDKFLADTFVFIESLLALVGGFSVVLLYFSFVFTPYFYLIQIILTFAVGFLSGLEIPILTRILNIQENTKFKQILAKVLSFDYLGGLAASLLFPFILLPYFGLVKLGFLVGIVNILMAFLSVYIFWESLRNKILLFLSSFILIILIFGAAFSNQIYNFVESFLYKDPIIYSAQTKYQRIVLTQKNSDLRLYLNGGIQFSSQDEYRYHESLVMPAMLQALNKIDAVNLKIAVLGGGDGLAVRELLKFDNYIAKIYVVDIDQKITDIAKKTEVLKNINQNSLNNPKVQILNTDAWGWLKSLPDNNLDLVISDFPDPDDSAIAKLYSKEFFQFAYNKLTQNGVFVTQSTSPYTTPKAFWSINKTIKQSFLEVLPYTIYIPSFGLWGFNLAFKNSSFSSVFNPNISLQNPQIIDILNKNRFLSKENISNIFILEKDIKSPKLQNGQQIDLQSLKINTIDNLILTNYYLQVGQEI
jgi:spermidine synthase